MAVKFKMAAIKTKRFQMDALNIEVHDEAAGAFEHLLGKMKESCDAMEEQEEELEETKSEKDNLEAEKDQFEEGNKKLKKELEDAEDPNGEKFQKALKEKKELDDAAEEAEIDEEEKKKDSRSVKIAIIKAKSSDFKADGKSDDYINARFDMIREDMKLNKGKQSLGDFNKQLKENTRADGSARPDPRADFLKKSAAMHQSA